MCGIAGTFQAANVKNSDVAGMIEAIGYRGVDEKGVHAVGPCVLGHARLAVVDRENGKQPMSNEDGTVWVTFNGEIYNFVELREELKLKGHRFKSRCDTEVLVHLWEEEGEAMLSRLIGMYTFLVWDENKKTGMLARDRQGIKPCFIADYNGGLAFASEMKAILALPGFKREINRNTLYQVFAFNYPPLLETCFKGIRHVMPGSFLRLQQGKQPEPVTYWHWPLDQERKDVPLEEFGALLDDAIRLQMRFDVPGGLFLSGGVDSSVLAHHLSKIWPNHALEATGLEFKVDGYSELSQSEFVAQKYDIKLHKLEIKPTDVIEIAEKVVQHAEEPHGDFSYFLIYQLAREAHRQGRVVMFNGDGPDEALLGLGHNEAFLGLGRLNFSMRTYFDRICYMNSEMRNSLLSPEFFKGARDPYETFGDLIEPYSELEPIEQVSAYELNSLMPFNNNVKGDRMGACWSVEGRSPLMDHRISELFSRLPLNRKFKDAIGKHYLKSYAAQFLPHDFIFRPKKQPTMPIGEWIKGPLYSWAHTILSQDSGGMFNQSAVLQLLEDHRSGKRNHTQQLRTLLMTQLWLKNFFH